MYNWNVKIFNSSAWDAVKRTIQNDDFHTEYSDFFGCITCGAVCFDLVLRDVDSDGYLFCADPYILGIDSGYAYAKDGTPYDEYDGFCLDYNTSMNFDDTLSSFISQIDTFTVNDKTLAEYAGKTDVTWNNVD